MLSQKYNIPEIIEESVVKLRPITENSLVEIKLMLSHVLQCTYEDVYFQKVSALTKAQYADLMHMIERRSTHEPLAKILGYKEFWDYKFKVNHATLDPRPDSELIVEKALHFAHLNFPESQHLNVLDLGVGSGCLLLSFLKNHPNSFGVGVDISPQTLEVALDNLESLGLENRAKLMISDWFQAVPNQSQYDIILCNPPYIDRGETYGPELAFDPPQALFAANNGLRDYEKIAISMGKFLSQKGRCFLEIGHTQNEPVSTIFQNNGFQVIARHLDLQGIIRCLEIGF